MDDGHAIVTLRPASPVVDRAVRPHVTQAPDVLTFGKCVVQLGARMLSIPEDEATLEGKVDIPAGYTYQLVDHDLTFASVATLDRQNELDALTNANFRTPWVGLDSSTGASLRPRFIVGLRP